MTSILASQTRWRTTQARLVCVSLAITGTMLAACCFPAPQVRPQAQVRGQVPQEQAPPEQAPPQPAEGFDNARPAEELAQVAPEQLFKKPRPSAPAKKVAGSRSTGPELDPKSDEPEGAQGNLTGPARRFALLVGVTEYNSRELNDLIYPDADVEALAEILLKKGYLKSDVVVLNSGRGKAKPELLPTAEAIEKNLDNLLKKASPNDLILVALSGHGHQRERGPAHFCAYQAMPSTNKGMVAVEGIVTKLSQAGVGMKMLFVDACRDSPGDRAVKREFSEGFDTTTAVRAEGVISFYSCSKGERSWELDALKHGLFFDLLIKGLEGQADDFPDGKVTWTELVGYVNRSINFYAQQYKRKQTPHFKGETTRNIPLVEFEVQSAPVEVKLNANDILDEHFAFVKNGQLPRGWEGEGFEKKFDEKNKRHCIELRKPEGIHWLTPALSKPLEGDFAIEVEFVLHGDRYSRNYYKSHWFTVCFEGEDGYMLPVSVNYDGLVQFPETQPRKTSAFASQKINRMRLIRRGNSYNVEINDGDAASTTIAYQGAFEGIRIGMIGGHFENQPSRMYSIRCALIEDARMPTTPERTKTRFGKTVLAEDFRRQNLGAILPTGWTGEGFSLTTDERLQRRCLEVNKADQQLYWLTLPKLSKEIADGGDFYVDFECCLSGDPYTRDPVVNHQAHFRLEGPNSLPFHAFVDYKGDLFVDGNQTKKISSWHPLAPNRMRVVQKNGVFRISCNESHVSDFPADRFPYDTLRMALAGSAPDGFRDENLAARLYSVKVVSLPSRAEKLQRFAGVYEDFRTLANGKMPPGWTAKNFGAHAPTDYGRFLAFPRIVFTDDEVPGGIMESPPILLGGNFRLECDFEYTKGGRHDFGGLNLALMGSQSKPLVVQIGEVKSEWFMGVLGYPPSKITGTLKASNEINNLVIERKETIVPTKTKDKQGKEKIVDKAIAGYLFTLNGQGVGSIPAKSILGPFERLQIQAPNPTKGKWTAQIRKIVAGNQSAVSAP